MKVMRCFFIILILSLNSSLVAYNSSELPRRKPKIFDGEVHEIKNPLVSGILYKVTRTKNGNSTTSLETSFLAKAGFAAVGLGAICGYYYGVYKGFGYLSDQTTSFFSSFGDLFKSSNTVTLAS